jgi:excisionase family DNA binding protein
MVRKKAAAKLLSIGLTKIDELIGIGALPAKKSGKLLLIPYTSLEKYVASLPPADYKLPKRLRVQRTKRVPVKPATNRG